jgi:Fic family protein
LPVAWNEDDPRYRAVLGQNLARVLRKIHREAPLRRSPTVSMAREWHREIFQGIPLPVPYYAGEVRDSDSRFPELYGYEVVVGPNPGVASRLVPRQLVELESRLQQATGVLDANIPIGSRPDRDQLWSVLSLCAHAHGEWVRIHPFANGNGRTARLWANWCALRYRLPPFVRLQPRPAGNRYALASAISMQGDHQPTTAVFADMLDRVLRKTASR